MAGTRRSARRGHDEEEEEAPAMGTAHEPSPSGSDDDDAPEEVTLDHGKQAAAQQRRLEKSAKQQATEASKERSRKRQRPAAAPAAAAAAATAVIEEAQELDLLPESVLEEMVEAEVNDRRLMERRVVTEELRAALARPARQRQRQKFTERQAGPVTVKVLSSVGDRRASAAAKAFLSERLHGGVKRSMEMLHPTKVGGVFVRGPAVQGPVARA